MKYVRTAPGLLGRTFKLEPLECVSSVVYLGWGTTLLFCLTRLNQTENCKYAGLNLTTEACPVCFGDSKVAIPWFNLETWLCVRCTMGVQLIARGPHVSIRRICGARDNIPLFPKICNAFLPLKRKEADVFLESNYEKCLINIHIIFQLTWHDM